MSSRAFAASLLFLAYSSLGLRINQKKQVPLEGTISLAQAYPFYHSSETINQELAELAKNCPVLSIEPWSDSTKKTTYQVVKIHKEGNEGKCTNRNFFLFGEHARELISPESGLHFVKTICEHQDVDATFIQSLAGKHKSILDDNCFMIVMNANPHGRLGVEAGDFCKRTNENDVDINRNWDEAFDQFHAGEGGMSGDTFPGERPFSEPETQILKGLLESFKPTNFLTVHSGTRGMYMPWAYDMEHLADRNGKQMMNILYSLDKKYCQCPFGAAGKEVGYQCPGTSLDWVYDKLKTPFAFAVEIWNDQAYDAELKANFDQHSKEMMRLDSNLADKDFAKVMFERHPSDNVQLLSQHGDKHKFKSKDECFSMFNPTTPALYKETTETWSNVYFDLVHKVTAELHSSKVQK